MSENPIVISNLNDFIFCPISIYFHNLYYDMETTLYQDRPQLDGKAAHKAIDTQAYSTSANILQALDVYCEKYNLIGKIDIFDKATGTLTERKKKVHSVYDGYVWQLYAQYFALEEMGYIVKKLRIHSIDDNKNYNIPLPTEDKEKLPQFEKLLEDFNSFDFEAYQPKDKTNVKTASMNRIAIGVSDCDELSRFP